MPLWHWKKFLFTSVNSLPFSWNPSPRRNAPTKSASLFPGFIFGRFFGFKNETPPKHQILKFDKIVLPHDFWYESIATSRDKLCQKRPGIEEEEVTFAVQPEFNLALFSSLLALSMPMIIENICLDSLEMHWSWREKSLVSNYTWESSIQMSIWFVDPAFVRDGGIAIL